MEQNNRQQPMSIFGLINQNVVDLSKEIVELRRQVHEIHCALFTAMTPIETEEKKDEPEPTIPGTEESETAPSTIGDEE